jgi:hypothetical protein
MAVGVAKQAATPEAEVRQVADDNRFDKLVLALKRALGPSSGLASDDVNVDDLRALMEQYDSKPEEWKRYAFGDSSRGYTRNLVDEGNGKSNLVSSLALRRRYASLTAAQLVLVWTPGKGSPIHDHGNAHCLMKILRGTLTETRFDFPDSKKEQPMKVKSEKTLAENKVAYMADELGVHRVSNEGSDFAVSLHRKHRCMRHGQATNPDTRD